MSRGCGWPVIHEQVDPGMVAAWVLRRVVEAGLSHQHFLVGALLGADVTVKQRVGDLVAAVSEPGRVKWPVPPRVVHAYRAEPAARGQR